VKDRKEEITVISDEENEVQQKAIIDLKS